MHTMYNLSFRMFRINEWLQKISIKKLELSLFKLMGGENGRELNYMSIELWMLEIGLWVFINHIFSKIYLAIMLICAIRAYICNIYVANWFLLRREFPERSPATAVPRVPIMGALRLMAESYTWIFQSARASSWAFWILCRERICSSRDFVLIFQNSKS